MWAMPYEPADLERLATRVAQRRTELRLSVDEAARRARPRMSNTTWHRVEDGLPVRDTSYARIDAVLGWAEGSCQAILTGGAEREAGDAGEVRISEAPLSEEALRLTVQSATIATLPDLTGAQIASLAERAVQEARRQGLLPPATNTE